MQYGIVIRADGTVPFDDDKSDDFAKRKLQTIELLKADGHKVLPHPDHDRHMKIAVWPPVHACKIHPKKSRASK